MTRSFLVVALLLVLTTTSARADSRTTWQGVFVGSAAVVFLGSTFFWYGSSQIDHAEEQLCTGDYAGSACDHPPPTSAVIINMHNERGDTGVTYARAGAVMMVAGGGLGVVALYKGFIAKDKDEEPEMVIAPTVSPHGAGASLQFRF
jgi:hypothetical protein